MISVDPNIGPCSACGNSGNQEPKQILEEFFEDDDDESESTTMTLAQFPGKNSDMQCCACPGPTTPTLSSMMTFDFDENSDSFFEGKSHF